MGRPSKGPRLYLHHGVGRNPAWIIQDGERRLGTGCSEGQRSVAEGFLDAYKKRAALAPPPVAIDLKEPMIYVIGPTQPAWPVKIGTSRSVEERLSDLQTAHHQTLVIHAQAPGGVLEEKQLHRLFRQYRLNGEWFRRSEEIEKFILLIGYRDLPLHLAVKWVNDDRNANVSGSETRTGRTP